MTALEAQYRALRVVMLALEEETRAVPGGHGAREFPSDPIGRETLIRRALQYGKRIGVKRADVEAVLDTPLASLFCRS